ncbi:MAG TPA: hypothetical protein PK841_09475 [Chitinophagaceae bacterium]|nr:hypothetical protein [Chitinophagaceae bacterium]
MDSNDFLPRKHTNGHEIFLTTNAHEIFLTTNAHEWARINIKKPFLQEKGY